jgi:hypothetical protein
MRIHLSTVRAANLHWIDNFHAAYVLDSFKHYIESTGDDRFRKTLMNGYEYWKKTFVLPDGLPGTIAIRPSRSTSSAVPRRSTRSFSFVTSIRKACCWR